MQRHQEGGDRKVLSLVSSVFDPLGLLAPFNVEIRRLLKSIWSKCGQQWDEAIDAEAEAKFLKWKEQLPIVAETNIDRKVFKRESLFKLTCTSSQMHQRTQCVQLPTFNPNKTMKVKLNCLSLLENV